MKLIENINKYDSISINKFQKLERKPTEHPRQKKIRQQNLRNRMQRVKQKMPLKRCEKFVFVTLQKCNCSNLILIC